MSWNGPAAWSKRESCAGVRLPYARHLDERTLLLRDGALMRTLHLTGLPFETESADALNHHQTVREVLLRSALDARFMLYHHVVRHAVPADLGDTRFEQPFAAALNERWQARLASRRLFVNEQFVTVVRRPARGKSGWVEKLGRRLRQADAASAEDRRLLDAAMTALTTGLSAYGARPLGQYARGAATCSELMEFLSALYNGEMRPVAPPATSDLGHHLPYRRVSFGLDAMETSGPGSRDFGAVLSVKEYPAATHPGILDSLLRLPHELVLTESFAPADRQIARERIDLALRRHKVTDDDGPTERMEMLAAKDALSAGAIGFGDHHLTVLVRAAALDEVDAAIAQTAAALADVGAVAVREDTNLEPAFWAQFPGNERYIVRRALVSTANAAGFLSLHGFPMGQAEDNHWGPAATLFETTSATPYHFNFHQGDLGNFTVIGPSGSGKTVVLNFLAAQAQKFSPRLVFFDKDRGAEIFLRAMGGHYARLVPGTATGFNPLALPDSAENRAFLCQWLAALLGADAQELTTIARAVDACFEHDAAFRRLRYFQELLADGRRPQEGDLCTRLGPFVRGGEHAWLFDNASDELDLDRMTLGFDMTALLDAPRLRTPAMMYLFHRIDQRLNGEPAMILIDEGWKALDDEVFAARLRDWLKTLRKRNAIVGFATQSARDALDSRISAALVEQTATMLFMPNAKAREEDYCAGFGLSAHELDIIRALPAHSRCFLIRHANHSVVARLDLSGMNDVLTVLSGRESSVRRLDMIRARVGDDPAAWYPLLTNAAWPGAAEESLRAEHAE